MEKMNKLIKFLPIIILLLAVNQQGYAMDDQSDDYTIALALQDEEMACQLQQEEEQTVRQINADAKLAYDMQEQLSQPGKRSVEPRPAVASQKPVAPMPRQGLNVQLKAQPAQPKMDNQNIIPLPAGLNGKNNIVQFKVREQGPNECGFHALLNARAIQLLVTDYEPITPSAVQQKVALYNDFIKQKQLEDPDMLKFAGEVGLERTIVLAFNRELQRFYVGSCTADITHIAETLEIFFLGIIPVLDEQNACDFHIICNTGGHWVSISAVRDDGNQIKLYYCNSSNASLKIDSLSYGFVTIIRQMLDQILGN